MNNTKLIRNYDFAEAKFDSLPKDIFKEGSKNLSKMDQAILDGIRFQMTISKYNDVYQNIKQYIMIQESRFKIQDFSFMNHESLIINHNLLEIRSIRLISNFVLIPVVAFFLLSLTYYANVNLNLGLNFITNLFA